MTSSTDTSIRKRYMVETNFNGGWLVVDMKTREVVQTWKTLSAASEHCKQLEKSQP